MIKIFELGIIIGRLNHVLPGLGSETYLLPCQLLKLKFLTVLPHSPETHAGLVCTNGPLLAEDLLTKSMEQTAIIPRL